MRTSLIVAADEADVIGRSGGLPWSYREDLLRFKRLTLGHAVVVGRRTHDGIVERLGHPLPGRFSVVVTSGPNRHGGDGVVYQTDVGAALELARGIEGFAGQDEVFIIGGAQIYAQLLGEVDRVYLTRVHRRTDGDAIMPSGWLKPFTLVHREDSTQKDQYSFLTYERGQQ